MTHPETSAYLSLLRNHINIKKVPFSDRGSRLLVLQDKEQPCLSVKLAERLTTIQPDIEAYLRRPPFIQDFYLLDEAGDVLDFSVVTYPHIVHLQTRVGDFSLVFQDDKTIALGLPPRSRTGVRFHVQPQFWETTEGGGVFKAVRNLVYSSNCETLRNEIVPDKGGYIVEYIVQADDDSAIWITIRNGLQTQPEMQPSLSPAVMQRHAGGSGSSASHRSTKNTGSPMLTPGGLWPTISSDRRGKSPTRR